MVVHKQVLIEPPTPPTREPASFDSLESPHSPTEDVAHLCHSYSCRKATQERSSSWRESARGGALGQWVGGWKGLGNLVLGVLFWELVCSAAGGGVMRRLMLPQSNLQSYCPPASPTSITPHSVLPLHEPEIPWDHPIEMYPKCPEQEAPTWDSFAGLGEGADTALERPWVGVADPSQQAKVAAGVAERLSQEAKTLNVKWQHMERRFKQLASSETGPEWFGCDTSAFREDICRLIGDVRVDLQQSRAVLYAMQPATYKGGTVVTRPYPNKQHPGAQEKSVSPIQLSSLLAEQQAESPLLCQECHTVPLVIFSIKGYVGNTFHTFTDNLVPLYITTQHYKGEVRFGLLDSGYPHDWWLYKFRHLLAQLTNYPILRLGMDSTVHCFRDVIVGLRFHDVLHVDPARMPHGETIHDFSKLVAAAYNTTAAPPRGQGLGSNGRLRLGVVDRNGTRVIRNIDKFMRKAAADGFEVKRVTGEELGNERHGFGNAFRIFQWADAVIGVHGAGLSHQVFMRPNTALIQIVPFGLGGFVSETYFGEPARRNSIKYWEYLITKEESSLSERYQADDWVFRDPDAVRTMKGWDRFKEMYLNQDVTLSDRGMKAILKETKKLLGS